ncbi:MAG: biotin--[acetyl-CoA-carboxylase] ligase [Bacteroidales bacterium]|nr:biotin--[acetyl-CoA-carboxylase] ligase [Bacteroidales bacterium]
MKIKWFKTIDSTNNRIALDKEELADRTVYMTDFQTAGKGQRGNGWESAKAENLLFSILFKPSDIAAEDQFIISQAVTLGIADYIRSKGIAANIKWPNDIYVYDRKICGILIENTVNGSELVSSIVGIGFNLNQLSFSPDIPNPVSLSMLTDVSYDLKDELLSLLHFIFREYDRRSPETAERYVASLYRLGEQCSYIDTATGQTFTGAIKGVDKTARVLIDTEEGERAFAFKELQYII